MGAIDIQVDHHRETLDKQKLDKIIQLPSFLSAWENASESEHLAIRGYIDALDAKAVASWVRRLNFGDLQALTTKELRQEASNNHIAGYSRFTKDELREAIENVR